MEQPSDSGSQVPPHSDNVEEELGRIYLALNAVFSHSHGSSTEWWSQRQLADRYLASFQRTRVSWIVCDRILQDGGAMLNRTLDHQETAILHQRLFFAAQTLHSKCSQDIFELPPESFESLRSSLLNHLQRYTSVPGGRALTNRLAMCVAVLAVHMNWTSITTDLLSSHGDNGHISMAILAALPEECASNRLVLVDENSRLSMRDHLVSSAPLFFRHLREKLVQESSQAQQVLKTLHLWVRYVPVQVAAFMETPLLQDCVGALMHAEHMEVAADVIVEILRMYPSRIPSNEALVKMMVPLLNQLPFDQALSSDDEDVLRTYCRIITEMGESYMSIILSANYRKDASLLVDRVLRCSAIADQEISSITLHFWYLFVLDLDSSDPYDWRQELIDTYTTQLLQLIHVCAHNLMAYPADISTLADDLVDDVQRHRFYVAETVEDCCRLLGGESVLLKLGSLLQEEVHTNSADLRKVWQGIESKFSCICAICRFVPTDEDKVLPYCFQLIPQLPTDIGPLRYTICKLIGKYSSWLSPRPELLSPLLPYLAQGLHDSDCAPAASIAIKELCECSNQRFPIADPVLQLYIEISSNQGDQLQLQDELQVLEGVCYAITRQIFDTRQGANASVGPLIQPITMRLAIAVADPDSSPGRIIPEIERLTVISQHLKIPFTPPNPHPLLTLTQSCWEYFETASNRFPGDNNLHEKICRLHKHTLRSCGAEAYAPMLEALIKFLIQCFDRSRQSALLYAASICITEYGSNRTYSQQLYDMVASLSTTVFSFLRNIEDLTNFPDVVEEFFYLMGRMISYCPDPLVTSPLMHSLVQCAIVGMELDHQGANKGTLRFLEDTISYGLKLRELNKPDVRTALEHILGQEGQSIVFNLARALVGELPAYNERQIPEILWKLSLLCSHHLPRWLVAAFQKLGKMPDRAKADFLGALDTGLARDEFSLAVRAFQTACQRERRFRGDS